MNDDAINTVLLPAGFSDLLPPDAEQEASAISTILKAFSVYGFQTVKPPLVEYEESLFAPGPGASLKQEAFRLMDPVSRRMMGVRSDITAQIARIAKSRLHDEARPLRLSYANDVLRTTGSQRRTTRQFTQVGCEIIGWDDVQADIELGVVVLDALAALALDDVVLDINLPRFTDMVLKALNVEGADKTAMQDAILNRDAERVKKLDTAASELFCEILSAQATGAEALMDVLKALDVSADVRNELDKVSGVYIALHEALEQMSFTHVRLNLDVLENYGGDYHCGVAFALFSGKAKGPLGRGGRYTIFGSQDKDGQPESATGFTIYMDTLRQAMTPPQKRDMVFVDVSESWGEIKKLQEDGWTICRGVRDKAVPDGCTHEYKNGHIEIIKRG